MAANPHDFEIIAMFNEGSIVMPDGAQTAAIEDITFEPDDLKTTLLDHGALTMIRAFPDYDPSDSLIESPHFPGLFAKQPRLDWVYKIVVADPAQRGALNDELSAFEEVWYAESSGGIRAQLHLNDRDFVYQWNMYNSVLPAADINAMQAWDYNQGNPLATIGIIDLGVDLDHWEFIGRAISGWEEVHADSGNGQVSLLAWNDLGDNQDGIEDPIVSNGREIYLGQFIFSLSDTSDIRDFALLPIDNARTGAMMLGHPNGTTFSLPNFRFRDGIYPKETDRQHLLKFSLMQNTPNPFNAQTTIEYALPEQASITLDIFDIQGRKVAALQEGVMPAGYHMSTWDAHDAPSGIYIVRLRAGEFAETRKITLLK
jgi:hypothetical protein